MDIFKKIITCSFLLLLLGCDTNSLDNKKTQKEYENRVEQELNSGLRNDDIFMTFKFGDSENDVNTKFKRLKDNGKITLDDKKRYTYEFVFDEFEFNNGHATFLLKYHNNKLYQFRIIVKPNDDMKALGGSENSEFLQTKSEGLFYSLAMLYMEKFGHQIRRRNALFKTKDCFWINGNREIEISLSSGFVNVIYTDLSSLRRMEEEKKNKLRNEAKVTKKDI